MKTKILFITVIMFLLSCQNKKENDEANITTFDMTTLDLSMPESPACAVPPPVKETVKFAPPVIKDNATEENTSSQSEKTLVAKHKKIIKDGSLSIKVKTIEEAKKRMDATLKTYNAYYENESFINGDVRLSYNLKIRVPAKQFESFLKASENGLGEIIHKNISARDVTEDYMDVETRLNSKRLFRNRYNQLLEKATKIDDIMAIEENIRALQEEIESQEGHLKFIDDQVNYSTLEINLFTDKVISKTPEVEETFFHRLKDSIANGWNTLVSSILWGFTQWPWVLVISAFVVCVKIILKRRKK